MTKQELKDLIDQIETEIYEYREDIMLLERELDEAYEQLEKFN